MSAPRPTIASLTAEVSQLRKQLAESQAELKTSVRERERLTADAKAYRAAIREAELSAARSDGFIKGIEATRPPVMVPAQPKPFQAEQYDHMSSLGYGRDREPQWWERGL